MLRISFVFVEFLFVFLIYNFNFVFLSSKIRVRDKWMVDDYGRVRLFHGFHSVKKGPPWFDDQIFNQTRLKYLKKWGFNVVRLGAMWSGVEPTENQFNETYLNILQKIVDTLESHNMHVILDMHQDVFSSDVCDTCYDGFPKWLSSNYTPSIKYPWPFTFLSKDEWFFGYFSNSVSSAFQQFYNNVSGSIDKFVRFWQKLAQKFKNQNNVLSYELLNEPWAGDIYSDSTLILPGIAGSKNLKPLYDILFTKINEVDNETLIFYEPVTWGVIASGNFWGSGFDELPGGGDKFRNRSVLSYHIYCLILESIKVPEDYPFLLRTLCDDIIANNIFLTVSRDIEKTGGSSFLTEFGNCEPDGNAKSIDTLECNAIMKFADQYLQSWTYWDSLFFDENGLPKEHVFKAFSRPYARAVAGIPSMMKFDKDELIFEFEFWSSVAITQPTEIFIPSVHYPLEKGLSVETTPFLKWSYDPVNFVVKIKTFHLNDSTLVKIKIKPS